MRRTPATAYRARESHPVHGHVHHIDVGRAHTGTDVLLLAGDRDIRIIDAATGELLREVILDATRDYQPRTAEGPNP